MSKTVVPKELQEKIIDLYVNKKYGRTRIVKELNLPFGEEKVKNILKENGCHIRSFQEAKAISDYDYSDLRKNKINDDYNFETHNGAWMLGFYAADGYLPITKGAKNRVVLSLQKRDEDVLHLIAKELGYTGEIKQYMSSNGFPFSSLAFTSQKIRATMEKYGIVNAKTFTLTDFPSIQKQYIIDFIRGYFDGDGSVYCYDKEKKVKMSFLGANKEFIEKISDFLHTEYDLSQKIIHIDNRHKHPAYYITYGKKESFILGDIFYQNDYLSLPRKKQHYFDLKDKYI